MLRFMQKTKFINDLGSLAVVNLDKLHGKSWDEKNLALMIDNVLNMDNGGAIKHQKLLQHIIDY